MALASASRSCVPGLLVLALFPSGVGASAFRGRTPDLAGSGGVDTDMEKALVDEIEEVLGDSHRKTSEGRLSRIEAVLRPTFAALPKNEHGRLERSAVRYAMHRLFVQRHAWFVTGLDPSADPQSAASGEPQSAASPTLVLQDQLPAYVHGLFERRIGQKGFGLHELAVMAATLENLVHAEAIGRLEHTYRALDRSTHDPVSQEEAVEVVDAYMAMYVLGLNFSSVSPKELTERRKTIQKVYPSWPATQRFLREVHRSTAPKRDELPFQSVATVVEEIGERYGRWQDHECRALKAELLEREDRGSGRVRLAEFYGSAVHGGNWQFSESVQYLRQLGALDESDPSNLRVIVPNYIQSPSNCVASSKYYSVCCMDECEEILRHVEERIGAPDGSPAEIAAAIASLPAAGETGGARSVSLALLQKLEEVASHHGGRAPLHGRLFLQWLHFAYPRECPYPHVAGATNPLRAEEWMATTGQESSATADEMKRHAADARRGHNGEEIHSDDVEAGMWTMEEELVVTRPEPPRAKRSSLLRGAFFAAAVGSSALALFQVARSAADSGSKLLLPMSSTKKLKV